MSTLEDYPLGITVDSRLRSQRSISVPATPDKAAIRKAAISRALGRLRSPLPASDNSRSDEFGQCDAPTPILPAVGRLEGVPSMREVDNSIIPSILLRNRRAVKSVEEAKQSHGLQPIRSRERSGGQYFRLAHKYAELAHAAAQVELHNAVDSLDYDTSNYWTKHPFYYLSAAAMLNEQYYYMHARAYGDPSGIPEAETGNEVGWTPGAWNVRPYGEPDETEWFYSTK